MSYTEKYIERLENDGKSTEQDVLFFARKYRVESEEVEGLQRRLTERVDEEQILYQRVRELESQVIILAGRRTELEDENYQLRHDQGYELRQKAENYDTLMEDLRQARELGVLIDPTHIKPFMLPSGKIPTIKVVRWITGLGLKEAKDTVDRWIAEGLV